MPDNAQVKTRDIPITVVRLPPDLRLVIAREAQINRVSLNAEITRRLLESTQDTAHIAPLHEADGVANMLVGEASRSSPPKSQLTDAERVLLSLFATLEPAKQLSLLTLLKR